MILVNSQKAQLYKNNRNNYSNSDYFDDEDTSITTINVVPYNVDNSITYGTYTIPEATGYYIVNRNVDIDEGDQIVFIGKFANEGIDTTKHTVSKVEDNWIFNRIENKVIVVK